jgi:hypothetical protein
MPWVSNQTADNIVVSITKKTGGDDSNFTLKPAIPYGTAGAVAEGSSSNYWTRSGAETLKVVVGGKEKTFEVQKDDHVNIYINAYEIVTAKFGWF